MRNVFQRFARAVEAAEPGIVDGPADPGDTPTLLYSAADPDIVIGDGTPVPAWAQRRIEDQAHQLTAKNALIDVLGQRLADALAAAAVPLADAMPQPSTEPGLASELAAVRADRGRLETVNDELREQLRRARLMLAARTGTPVPDGLLVPWRQT